MYVARRVSWHAEGGSAGTRLDEEGVGVAVIAADELDDLVPSREPPREPDGRHGGLGPRVHQAQLVNGSALRFLLVVAHGPTSSTVMLALV